MSDLIKCILKSLIFLKFLQMPTIIQITPLFKLPRCTLSSIVYLLNPMMFL